jgi:anti-sigma regulatory factor (Ser/Thr protein kinase)
VENNFKFELRNELSELARVTEEIHACAGIDTLDSQTVYTLDLTLEEMLSNVIKYAYSDNSSHTINLSLKITEDKLILTIEDDGNEFDTEHYTEPELSNDISERPIGGVGIHLVRNMTESVKYQRKNDRNILEITILKHKV